MLNVNEKGVQVRLLGYDYVLGSLRKLCQLFKHVPSYGRPNLSFWLVNTIMLINMYNNLKLIFHQNANQLMLESRVGALCWGLHQGLVLGLVFKPCVGASHWA